MSEVIQVMIVEDDEVAAKIYGQFLLKIDGFQAIVTAGTGKQALELLKVITPNLILLDVYLPDINGLELLREVRKSYRGIDVILITAANDSETVSEAIRGGAFSYMIKPISIDKFLETMGHYLKASRKLRDGKVMSQTEVDLFFQKVEKDPLETSIDTSLPKGIDRHTLKNVREKIKINQGLISTDELAEQIGSTHSTARKYLEYLVRILELDVEVTYGTVGRPERKYKKI